MAGVNAAAKVRPAARRCGATMSDVADDFDVSVPSIARVYDYLLDGKDNFAADRAVAEKLLAVAPLTVQVTRENRQFLARAVTWAARQGIGQFIDLGCGMPTVPNTHGTAQKIDPAARVAQGTPGVTVIAGDVREPAPIRDAVADGVDLAAPACLMMGFLLHFFDPAAARALGGS